jgi:hypothetical protein
MEINGIFFSGESGGLLPPAALEGGLKHFKKEFGLRCLGVNFHPGPAFFALG